LTVTTDCCPIIVSGLTGGDQTVPANGTKKFTSEPVP
jgi:hypothetical protein